MTWEKILAQGFTSVNDLLDFLSLPPSLGSSLAEMQFKTRVPRGFAARMEKGNAQDPLLLQVLASVNELVADELYVEDPLDEMTTNLQKGLIHKYQGRVLLTLTGVCAINCRYCFRRHFPYQDNNPGRKGWKNVFDYIRDDKSIHEVILSGGDPLLASDQVLAEVIHCLDEIPHVRTLRFHTRIPIVLPERIDQSFLALLASTGLQKVIVLHSNHAQEINVDVQQACSALQKIGCHLLNQSVLLKGVNDDVSILAALSERLFSCAVLPYYLHVLDKVAGASHFDLPEERALELFRELQGKLPGYLVPRLAREEPGKISKTLLI